MPLKACDVRIGKKGMMLLLRGLATRSVRPWREWNRYKRLSSTQVSDQRGTCLAERPAKGGLCVCNKPP